MTIGFHPEEDDGAYPSAPYDFADWCSQCQIRHYSNPCPIRDDYERRIEKGVIAWHESNSDLPLHIWLGMSWVEYGRWVEQNEEFMRSVNRAVEEAERKRP
jgi:hypothetical protein